VKIDARALKQRAQEIYGEFTAGQRAMVVVAVIALVVGGMAFTRWAAAPSWVPLYTNLEATEAAEVTQELDSMGVGYQLADAGTTIMVGRDAVYQTRLDLSAQGLPRVGGDGWNLIDQQGLTTSEFRQRVDYQRAMEGELARTIASMAPVETATVHLVMPEDDLFSGDDVHPSASVLVDPAGIGALGASQVQAIVHLVASSVEGMTPEFVTVADTEGRVLSTAGADGADLAAGDQRLSQKATFESAVAASIQDLLEPVTGPGRARVVVSADLDFDQRERVSETFAEPGTSPIVSETNTNETYVNGGQIVGGVLGPDARPVPEGEASEYGREEAARTFAVDKVTEQVKAAPGNVQRLSVAVLVDETAGVNTGEIADLVTAGAGLVPERGDTIEVNAMAFNADGAPALDEGTTAGGQGDDMVLTLARTGGVLLLVALVLFLAYRSARRSTLAKYPVAIPLPDPVDEAQAILAGLADELERGEAAGELAPAERPRQLVLQGQIGELIDRQPEDVAAVLRTWLADRRG
jgi:flagellar M-ring protein FliF